MTKYIGKCLLVEEGEKRILVIGDLHLGYEASLNERGIFVGRNLFSENIEYFDRIFEKVGKVDEIVLLGDVKHEFGSINYQEREEIFNLLEYFRDKCSKIIIVKGNHDKIVEYLFEEEIVKIVEYYVVGKYCFLHGDRDFDVLIGNRIKFWVVGHGHPAVKLREGVKMEKYKCFLVGKYKGKGIIIVPSFFEGNAGSDARENELKFAWKFKLENFNVKVVQEDSLEVLDFGMLKNIN